METLVKRGVVAISWPRGIPVHASLNAHAANLGYVRRCRGGRPTLEIHAGDENARNGCPSLQHFRSEGEETGAEAFLVLHSDQVSPMREYEGKDVIE